MRLNTCICIFLFTLLHGSCLYSGQESTDVAPFVSSSAYKVPSSGEIAIRTVDGERSAVVRINTVTIDRSNVAFPSSRLLSEALSGANEITVVKSMEILVDGQRIFCALLSVSEPDFPV